MAGIKKEINNNLRSYTKSAINSISYGNYINVESNLYILKNAYITSDNSIKEEDIDVISDKKQIIKIINRERTNFDDDK